MVVHGPKAIDHETWQKTSGEQSDSMLILLVGGKYQQRLNYGCDTDATIDQRDYRSIPSRRARVVEYEFACALERRLHLCLRATLRVRTVPCLDFVGCSCICAKAMLSLMVVDAPACSMGGPKAELWPLNVVARTCGAFAGHSCNCRRRRGWADDGRRF